MGGAAGQRKPNARSTAHAAIRTSREADVWLGHRSAIAEGLGCSGFAWDSRTWVQRDGSRACWDGITGTWSPTASVWCFGVRRVVVVAAESPRSPTTPSLWCADGATEATVWPEKADFTMAVATRETSSFLGSAHAAFRLLGVLARSSPTPASW